MLNQESNAMRKKNSIHPLLMLCILVISLLPFMFTSCSGDSDVPAEEEAQEAVMKKIQAANAGWASGNTMVFYENAAQNIVWIDDAGPSKRIVGRETLKTYLEGLKGMVPPHKHELYDFNFQFHDNIVIASYYYQGTFEGEKAPPWKAVSIFRYVDGDWFSILEHWTANVEG